MASENSSTQPLDDTLCFQMELDHHSKIVSENMGKIDSKVNLLSERVKTSGATSDCNEEILEAFKAFKQIPNRSDNAYEEMKNIIQKEKECVNEIDMYKQKIHAIKEQLKTKENEKNISKSEAKRVMKIYKHVISKYTTTFDFDVDVDDIQEDEFTAIVKIKGNAEKPIKFVIDKKQKCVKNTEATSINMRTENSDEDKENVKLRGVLYKLREL